ncbi:hypothetical protein Fot_07102 [Forsythia ovata]|uniref:Uncharacterized protein n=1 Tax=Forsythia ovata TaxID=205694 RepID=A0ABD1WUV3_9LAMI
MINTHGLGHIPFLFLSFILLPKQAIDYGLVSIMGTGSAQSKNYKRVPSRRIYIPKIGLQDYPRSKMSSSPEHGHNNKASASTSAYNVSLPSQSYSSQKTG